ncbi:hypothetical protein CEXT_321701 [Caerostris extrusa]|uniref:Uncharacterized protein n=1 Tax=Caerostris extrusa TaxID=172846 RepID=A0AAV4XZP4_CAEEX|nr:hypothetical protein CEXT_321701 [Caerostris extrusa]
MAPPTWGTRPFEENKSEVGAVLFSSVPEARAGFTPDDVCVLYKLIICGAKGDECIKRLKSEDRGELFGYRDRRWQKTMLNKVRTETQLLFPERKKTTRPQPPNNNAAPSHQSHVNPIRKLQLLLLLHHASFNPGECANQICFPQIASCPR